MTVSNFLARCTVLALLLSFTFACEDDSGSYELVAVAYEDTDNDGELEMQGRFRLDALLGINLGNLSINASSTTSANFTLLALLP